VYPRFPDRFQYLTMDIADHRVSSSSEVLPLINIHLRTALNG
jgi:hypothetical protein